jgi:hypothetical protein
MYILSLQILVILDYFSPNDKNFAQSVVKAMITIVGYFQQFSAKTLEFFLKTNIVIQFFHADLLTSFFDGNVFFKS